MDPFTVFSLVETPVRKRGEVLAVDPLHEMLLTKVLKPTSNIPTNKPIIDHSKVVQKDSNFQGFDDPVKLQEVPITVDAGPCLPIIGNYCGPYYSAGKIQSSVESSVPACSLQDQVCKEHDACLAAGSDPMWCDQQFVENPDASPWMTGLIQMQMVARNLYPTMTNLRGKKNKTSNKDAENKAKAPVRGMNGNTRIVAAPNSISVTKTNVKNAPKVKTTKNGMLVNHSELVSGVFVGSGAPTAYSVTKFSINPGKFATFPWLATVATNYDKYIFRKLRFVYMPLVSTTTAGRVGLCFDYDSSDSAPVTRADFFSATRHSEAAIWAPIDLEVPLDRKERFTNTHTASDSKLIDVGSLSYMTDATSATASSSVGDIICEYEVELLRPQPPSYATAAFSASNPAGTDTSIYLNGPSLGVWTFVSATLLQVSGLSPGSYGVFTYVKDTGAASPLLAYAATNATFLGIKSLATTTEQLKYSNLSVPSGNGSINFTITGTATLGDLESLYIRISKMDSSIPILT